MAKLNHYFQLFLLLTYMYITIMSGMWGSVGLPHQPCPISKLYDKQIGVGQALITQRNGGYTLLCSLCDYHYVAASFMFNRKVLFFPDFERKAEFYLPLL